MVNFTNVFLNFCRYGHFSGKFRDLTFCTFFSFTKKRRISWENF